MDISQIHDTLYNFFLETKLAEKGFVNTKNKELKYDLLYPAGVVLTVENKEFDTAWRADIEKLKKAEPNKKSSTYEWAKDKIEKAKIKINALNENDKDFLIECKYIFETIDDYDRIRRSDVSDALWGSIYSLINACIIRQLYPAIAMRYKEKLEKYRPFNEFEDFDKKVVLVWQNFLYSITEINYRKSYGTDYRNTARYLPEKIKSDITKAITFIGNTNEHRIKCEAAIQGAMISMIKAYEAGNDREKEIKEKALRNLGKITNNVATPIPPIGIEPVKQTGEEKMRTMYNQIKPGEKGLTGEEVNKISKAAIYQGMNFDKRVIMMGRNYNDFENNIDGDIIYYEGHNIRKDKTDKDPAYVDQPRTHQNAKFCDAVDMYKKGSEPAYINVFHNLGSNNWEYKGIYALVDYKYINSQGRKVYRFELKRYNS